MLAEIQTETICFLTKGTVKSIFLCPAEDAEYPIPCLLFTPNTQPGKKTHHQSPSSISYIKFHCINKTDVCSYNYRVRNKQPELLVIINP